VLPARLGQEALAKAVWCIAPMLGPMGVRVSRGNLGWRGLRES